MSPYFWILLGVSMGCCAMNDGRYCRIVGRKKGPALYDCEQLSTDGKKKLLGIAVARNCYDLICTLLAMGIKPDKAMIAHAQRNSNDKIVSVLEQAYPKKRVRFKHTYKEVS